MTEDRKKISELDPAEALAASDEFAVSQSDGRTRKGTVGQMAEAAAAYFNAGVGPQGLSAYEVWLAEGNEGSEADFLVSIQGPTGPTGPPGPAGPAGNGSTSYSAFAAQDLTCRAAYSGEAPTFQRLTRGEYRIDYGVTSVHVELYFKALDGALATNDSVLTLRINHPAYGDYLRRKPEFVNLDTGEPIWNWQAAGITVSTEFATNVTTYTISNVGTFNFAMYL